MKKLILILSLLAVGLSGCYVVPHRGQDDGYRSDRGDRDQRHDDDRYRDRRHDPSRDGYR